MQHVAVPPVEGMATLAGLASSFPAADALCLARSSSSRKLGVKSTTATDELASPFPPSVGRVGRGLS